MFVRQIMAGGLKDVLIEKINKSVWWHMPPSDPNAYLKRGKFLASSYLQDEFYGRPNIDGERVKISNPVYGFSEAEILSQLFAKDWKELLEEVVKSEKGWYKKRIALDRKMFLAAKKKGFDSIVLMSPSGECALKRGHKPRSIELNLLYPSRA